MFGTKCAVAKFRAVTTHDPDEAELIIRDWQWQATTVPFQDGFACVRTLGVHVNLAMDWKEQTQAASRNLARVGRVIRSKRVSAFAKVSTINLSVTQGLLYKGVNSV
jgi:hypothetical protein